jgi:hypothetical protein
MKLLKFTLPALAVLITGVAHAQNIENVIVEDGEFKIQVRTPPVSVEEMDKNGAYLPIEGTDSIQELIEIAVSAEDPNRLVRARLNLGNLDFVSAARPLVPQGLIPDPQTFRPQDISLNGDKLTIKYPLKQSTVAWPEKLPETFPLILNEGVITMERDDNVGTYVGTIPKDALETFSSELATALNRINNTGDGRVPVFQGRALIGYTTLPNFAAVGENIKLFPFNNGGEFEALSVTSDSASFKARSFSGIPILGIASAVDPKKSLMITDLSVVEDGSRTFDPSTGVGTENGKWTFAYLMEEMCNEPLTGIDPKLFAARWIQHFEQNQIINFDPVPSSNPALPGGGQVQVELIAKWNAKNVALLRHPFDLRMAPFRLTAIVNRIDLRDGSAYASGNAGECRFVFCAVDLDTGARKRMTVIFEYGVPISGCQNIKDYAQSWADLSSLSFGATFNTELETLTEIVAKANADSSKPNGSAINQLRSNDIIGVNPWRLREWQITGSGVSPNHLTEVTTKQTPADIKNGSSHLADFINTNEVDILASQHVVPLSFPFLLPFLSGKATTVTSSFFWNASGISNNDARHNFSLNTCNACHGGEASGFAPPLGVGSFPFVHVGERNSGVESSLSNFLLGTNMPMPDPVSGVRRTFNDLLRRAADLDFVANFPCLSISVAPSLNMTH